MKKTIKKLYKPFLIFFASLIVLFSSSKVYAHSGENGNVKVDDVVFEIMQKQNVSRVKDIDCKKVSDEDFEALGEALMSYMHPDERVHAAMDNMMGGEGSESLRQAHIAMGKRYLGCDPYFKGCGGMMGLPMMGFAKGVDFDKGRGWSKMMGFGAMGYPIAVWGIFKALTWLLLIVFLGLGSIYFWKEIRRKR